VYDHHTHSFTHFLFLFPDKGPQDSNLFRCLFFFFFKLWFIVLAFNVSRLEFYSFFKLF